jgi:hypothetical protein
MRAWFSRVNISLRTSAVLAAVSFVLCLVLWLAWLAMSSRTAVLAAQIEEKDKRRLELGDEVNRRWKELGELSAPAVMIPRAEALGFKQVEVEYLVMATEAITR